MKAVLVLSLIVLAVGSPVKRTPQQDCLKDGTCIDLGDVIIPKDPLIGGLSGTVDRKWPDGVIPYEIDPEFANSPEVMPILEEMLVKLNQTCITMRPKQASDEYWVRYQPSDKGEGSCYTYLGFTGSYHDSPKPINLGTPSMFDFCFSRGAGTPIHETMHAFGFVHEQMRDDRDDYITLHWENMVDGVKSQYQKSDTLGLRFDYWGEAYDYESIMHYSPRQGATCFDCPTMTAIEGTGGLGDPSKMGQRDHMTQSDIDGINNMYAGSSGCSKVSG